MTQASLPLNRPDVNGARKRVKDGRRIAKRTQVPPDDQGAINPFAIIKSSLFEKHFVQRRADVSETIEWVSEVWYF